MKKQTNFSVLPAILPLTSSLPVLDSVSDQVSPAATPPVHLEVTRQLSILVPALMRRGKAMKQAWIFGTAAALALALLAWGLYGPSVEAQKAPGGDGGVAGAQFPPMCGQMNPVASPNVGSSINDLSGMSALSNNDLWAVGSYSNGSTNQTLVEHWNGAAWAVVPSPNSGVGDALNGISALASNDVWAVGNYNNGSSANTLIEHWDGTAWLVISSPTPQAPTSGWGECPPWRVTMSGLPEAISMGASTRRW